jgi:hypothetical protein
VVTVTGYDLDANITLLDELAVTVQDQRPITPASCIRLTIRDGTTKTNLDVSYEDPFTFTYVPASPGYVALSIFLINITVKLTHHFASSRPSSGIKTVLVRLV